MRLYIYIKIIGSFTLKASLLLPSTIIGNLNTIWASFMRLQMLRVKCPSFLSINVAGHVAILYVVRSHTFVCRMNAHADQPIYSGFRTLLYIVAQAVIVWHLFVLLGNLIPILSVFQLQRKSKYMHGIVIVNWFYITYQLIMWYLCLPLYCHAWPSSKLTLFLRWSICHSMPCDCNVII